MATAPELLDRALGQASACERTDLHRRLTAVRQRIADPALRVLVVGEAKHGKSSLVNALVGAPVCAVGDDVSTAVPTIVRGGEVPRATLVLAGEETGEEEGDAGSLVEWIDVPIESVAERVTTAASGSGTPLRAEVELPRRLLEGGLEFVDTVGVGGVDPLAALGTLDLVPSATAVVFVSDATQEFTGPEMAFLRQAVALCPNVVCVVTKTDVCPQWRTIVDLDRDHLKAAGLDVPVFPVSSPLAFLAVQRRDRELHEESGLPALVAHLKGEVVEGAEALAGRSLVHDLTSVTDQLDLAVRSELTALEDPAGRALLVRELEEARVAVDELRRRSSRWQIMLNDGVTDLMADIDYDLRDRTRAVTRDAEEAIDDRDPGPLWSEFTDWLGKRVAAAVADSFVWAEQRSEWLAAQVFDQFARDGGEVLPDLSIGRASDVLETLVGPGKIDDGAMKVRERLFIGLRGSYTGVLMTGLVTSLAGMSLINPFSLAAGVLLGRKAYKDDKLQRTQRRQAEAKAVVRRHLDEVVFQAGKHLKDRLRLVQRTLRDLITDTVDEMSRTLADAAQAAQKSTRTATAEWDTRVRVLRQQLDEIERLAADVRAFAASPALVP